MAKVIISIHGLGNKPPKEQLEEWGRMAIIEGLNRKKIDIKLPKFELVYWADLFYDRPQTDEEQDKSSPYFLDEIYTKASKKYRIETHEIRKHFVDIVKSIIFKVFLKKDYHLRYSFVSQKFIHRYFHELEVYLTGDNKFNSKFNFNTKVKLIKRLSEVLSKHSDDEIMLVSHSMGTIVAFDVLSFISQNFKIDTFVTMGAPIGAPFVLSRIAEHAKKNYGLVKLQTPKSVYRKWYNFSDIRDNIALDYKLSDNFEANCHNVKCEDILVTNDYVMNGIANPHKSYGYLRTPEFIDVLIDFIKQ